MSIQLVGINHRTAPVEVRECLSIPEDDAAEVARALTLAEALDEALVLSTCNRVEYLASGTRNALRGEVLRRIEATHASSLVEPEAFYVLDGRDAVRHLFRVAASLDSMVIGEPQILGQVKDAYQKARRAGALGGPLDRLLAHAFHVARRVRNETEIGRMAVSVSYVAVELARKIFGDLAGLSVMLVGAGEMAESAAQHLRNAGTSRLFVTNRTLDSAERLAGRFGAEAVPFERLLEYLQRVDIVLSSTAAPGHILSRRTARGLIAARRNRPIFLVDIAVPRDIDPEINELDNVFVYDIDDLEQVAAANLRHRQSAAEQAERIVDDEVEKILHRIRSNSATPAIVSINRRLETIRLGELERYRSKLRDLTGEQRNAVDAVTRGIIAKVAHHPIREAKRSASDPRSRITVEDIRRIFGLE